MTDRNYDVVAEPDYDPLARGALGAIHALLDSGGIPRGTFADDHVRNLVVFYNWQEDALREIAAGKGGAELAKAVLFKIARAKVPAPPSP